MHVKEIYVIFIHLFDWSGETPTGNFSDVLFIHLFDSGILLIIDLLD